MNLKPKKSLGQNYLVDKNIINKIVNCVVIDHENEILEIGPGTGKLTESILNKKPKKVFLIEKDEKLSKLLSEKFQNKIKIFNDDILNFSNSKLLSDKSIIFGNLPYNISSQILIKFIFNVNNFKFKNLVFMFQKELADRIIAKVNTSEYGRLTILTNWKFNVKKEFDINPSSFFPKPKIKSSLLTFTKKDKIFKLKNHSSLEKITKIFFNQRRKKIRKQFFSIFENKKEIDEILKLDLNLRPQNLSPEIYFKIAREYEKL